MSTRIITPQPSAPPPFPPGINVREIPASANSIFEKAICLSLEMGMLGSKRKVSSSAVEVDADRERIGVSKSLMDCAELKAIKSMQNEARQYLYARALPAVMFRSGFYLIPVTLLQEVDSKMQDYRAILAGLVEKFLAVYPAQQVVDQQKLRAVFNAADYPDVDKVRRSFYLNWSYMSFGVPQNLPENMFSREQAKAREKLAEATDQLQQVLRAQMADLVNHLADRLSGGVGPNAKPKVFRDSLVTNAKEFLQLFRDRNITDDSELEALCDQASRLLAGVDPQALRDSDNLRETVRTGFVEIKSKLDGMMVDRPQRAISFEDEQ